MAGEKTIVRGMRRWPDQDAGGVDIKTLAAAGLSLGIIMFAMESDRLAALMHVGRNMSPLTVAVSLAVFAACAMLCARRPMRRPARPVYPMLAAVATSLSLTSTFFLGGAGVPEAVLELGWLLFSIAPIVLLFFWVQRVMPLGRAFVIRSFGWGALVLGCLGMLTAVLEHTVATVLVAALPLVGGALLTAVDARGAGEKGLVGEKGGRVTGWNALRTIACGGVESGPREVDATPMRRAVRALIKLVPFLCYAVIFGNVHFSWVNLQDGGPVGLWVQLGASIGTATCGFVALGLSRLHWGRAFESIVHLLLTVLALVALWLSTFLTSGYVFAYLVLLNVAQKLAFMLMLLFGFRYARNAGECASLWMLAYFSFFLGICVSLCVGELQASPALNIVAAAALTVVIIAEVADVALLYGGQPEGGARVDGVRTPAPEVGSATTSTTAAACPEFDAAGASSQTSASGGIPEGADAAGILGASTTPETSASGPLAAAAVVPPNPGFDPLPYTCHLIAAEYDLTRREEEILQLLVRGRTAARISETLCITTATTRTHLRNIYAKLDVHSQQDLLDLYEEYARRGA